MVDGMDIIRRVYAAVTTDSTTGRKRRSDQRTNGANRLTSVTT